MTGRGSGVTFGVEKRWSVLVLGLMQRRMLPGG